MLCVISGGNWNNTSNAGVWNANLNNNRTNANNNVGFRADSAPDGRGGVAAGVLAKRETPSRPAVHRGGAKSWSTRLSPARPHPAPGVSRAVFATRGPARSRP